MTIEITYAETVDVAAPLEKVFDYRLDFMNLADYMPRVKNVRRVDGGTAPGVGAEYRFDLTMPEAGQMEAFIKILEVDRPSRIVFDTGSADTGMGGTETSAFTPLSEGSTRVEFSIAIQLPDEAKDGVDLLKKSGQEAFRLELDELAKAFES
jgi:uncharacterized protein YndB with AHSA1/START domain